MDRRGIAVAQNTFHHLAVPFNNLDHPQFAALRFDIEIGVDQRHFGGHIFASGLVHQTARHGLGPDQQHIGAAFQGLLGAVRVQTVVLPDLTIAVGNFDVCRVQSVDRHMFRHDPCLGAHGPGRRRADHRRRNHGGGDDTCGRCGHAGHHPCATVRLRGRAALWGGGRKTACHDRFGLRATTHAIAIPAPHIALRQRRSAGASGDEPSRCRSSQSDGSARHHGHGARCGFAHDFGGGCANRGRSHTAHHLLRCGPGHGGLRFHLGRLHFGDAGRRRFGGGGFDLGLRCCCRLCSRHLHAVRGLETTDLLARAAHAGDP